MRVKFIVDTNVKEFENKVNKALGKIERDCGTVRSISSTVSHPKKMRGNKIVEVKNFFSAIIIYHTYGVGGHV